MAAGSTSDGSQLTHFDQLTLGVKQRGDLPITATATTATLQALNLPGYEDLEKGHRVF